LFYEVDRFAGETAAMLRRARYFFLSLKSKFFGDMTIFSKIISGEIPSYKIAENEMFFAFLDIFPLREGHVLVVPKTETDNFFDLPGAYLQQLLVFAQPIAKAIEKSFDCNRCGISVIGLEVPHAHMHLIPIKSANDLNFTQPKLKLGEERLKEIQALIKSNLAG
jgi:histidine triad (HIT) family protein